MTVKDMPELLAELAWREDHGETRLCATPDLVDAGRAAGLIVGPYRGDNGTYRLTPKGRAALNAKEENPHD